VTTFKRISLLLSLGACLAAAGCGSDDEKGKPIPTAQASELLHQLDGVQARLNNGSPGACKDILDGGDNNRDAVARDIDSLPNNVDPDIRDALQESFDNLWSLVESKCQDLKPDEPAQTNTTPTETTTTETQTETTETTPTTPTDTTTSPDTAPLPDDGNGGGTVPPSGDGKGGGAGPGAAKEKKAK
jgi:hypothetical protein